MPGIQSQFDLSKIVTLRQVTPQDETFLYQVHASTREDEMALGGWSAEQQRVFLEMQFQLQQRGYAQQYPHADHMIILCEGTLAGRLMIDRSRDDEILCVDISILTQFRNKGIGSYLLSNVMAEAATSGKTFRLRVLVTNVKALQLYKRLGFTVTESGETRIAMEWVPPAVK